MSINFLTINGKIAFANSGGISIPDDYDYELLKLPTSLGGNLLKTNDRLVGHAPLPPMPTKGQLITMDLGNGSQQYRVLKINDRIAECVAMYEYSTVCVFDTNRGPNNTYASKNIDTTLNTTFYNTLSSAAKSAIVQKNIIQYQYTYDDAVYNATTHASYADYSTKSQKEVVGDRYVYSLDIEDIEEYFNGTFSTVDILTLFWNTASAPSTPTHPWLRSAKSEVTNEAWFMNGKIGNAKTSYVNFSASVRPAFQINLSKINFTIETSN